MSHPCQFSPQIIEALSPIVTGLNLPVHDPFAGAGARLGALCDQLDVPFTGTEIEPEFIVDPRVRSGDSTMRSTYPIGPFAVVTSPAYPNGMTDHFEARDKSRRHTYRQGLAAIVGRDRPLHPNNMGRWGNAHRRSKRSEETHFGIARACVKHWPEHVVVNVKDVKASTYVVPVVSEWQALLHNQGYRIVDTIDVSCPGQRHGANSDLRVDHEAIILASIDTETTTDE